MDDASAGAVAGWAWGNRAEIAKRLKQVYLWFRPKAVDDEPAGILILGPGGAGKSTLGKLLSGEYDFLFDAAQSYSESLVVEHHVLKDAPGVEVVVPPGQPHRRASTWSDLHSDLANGKYRGVILISAFGYHTLGQISFKDHRLYQGEKESFLRAFLEYERKEELKILQQLNGPLAQTRGKVWLLSLVTKQDLWWTKRSEVEKHYREGDYAREVAEITASLGPKEFRHETIFASLVIRNFMTGKGERLKVNTEGYDQAEHASSLRRLFETVDALRQWEGGR